MDLFVLIGTGCVAVIVFIVASNALASQSSFSKGAAQVIGGIVGLLVVLSFLDAGKSVMSGLLLPYAALGVSCVVLLLFLLLGRCWRAGHGKKSWFSHHTYHRSGAEPDEDDQEGSPRQG